MPRLNSDSFQTVLNNQMDSGNSQKTNSTIPEVEHKTGNVLDVHSFPAQNFYLDNPVDEKPSSQQSITGIFQVNTSKCYVIATREKIYVRKFDDQKFFSAEIDHSVLEIAGEERAGGVTGKEDGFQGFIIYNLLKKGCLTFVPEDLAIFPKWIQWLRRLPVPQWDFFRNAGLKSIPSIGLHLKTQFCENANGQPMFLKIYNNKNDPLGEEARKEVSILRKVDHISPYFIKVRGYYQDGNNSYILTNRYPHRLSQFIGPNKKDTLDSEKVKDIARNLFVMLEQLHNRKPRLAHFSINPENILLDQYFKPILIGFKHCKECKFQMDWPAVGSPNFPNNPSYTCPEILLNSKKQERFWLADVYSVGAIIFELLFNRPLVSEAIGSDKKRISELLSKKRIEKKINDECGSNYLTRDLLVRILKRDSYDRVNADRALQEPVFLNEGQDRDTGQDSSEKGEEEGQNRQRALPPVRRIIKKQPRSGEESQTKKQRDIQIFQKANKERQAYKLKNKKAILQKKQKASGTLLEEEFSDEFASQKMQEEIPSLSEDEDYDSMDEESEMDDYMDEYSDQMSPEP